MDKILKVCLTLIRQPGSFSALALLTFGATLLFLQPFENSTLYDPMAKIAMANVWGIGFVIIGVARLFTFVCDYWFTNGHVNVWLFWVEIVSSAAMVAAFFVIFYMFLQGPTTTATTIYFLFMLSALVDFFDASHLMESNQLKKNLTRLWESRSSDRQRPKD